MFLLGHDPCLASQILAVITLAIGNPDYWSFTFMTKRQLYPSQFGSENCKLIVLPFFAFRSTLQRNGKWSIHGAARLFFESQSWYLAKGKTL